MNKGKIFLTEGGCEIMKKIIFYSLLSFESLMVWCFIYHAELIPVTAFVGELETIRVTIKTISMIMAIVFNSLLAYECFKKRKNS